MLAKDLEKDLKTDRSTWYFLFMCIITAGVYSIVWDVRFIEVFQNKYNLNKNVVKKANFRLWAYVILYFFLYPMVSYILGDIAYLESSGMLEIFTLLILTSAFFIITLLCIIFSIAFTLEVRKILRLFFKAHSINRHVNLLCSILFGSIYIYYVIRTIPQESVIDNEQKNTFNTDTERDSVSSNKKEQSTEPK